MDSVRLEMKRGDSTTVRVVHDTDGTTTGCTAVPADEWTSKREEVLRHYRLNESTRVDCINIITALTLALEDS